MPIGLASLGTIVRTAALTLAVLIGCHAAVSTPALADTDSKLFAITLY